MRLFPSLCIPAFMMLMFLPAQSADTWRDPSPHTVQFVNVEQGVQLEVLDWGGNGRAIVLLAGSGNTAHVFDDFAPKLAGSAMCMVLRAGASGLPAILRPDIRKSA